MNRKTVILSVFLGLIFWVSGFSNAYALNVSLAGPETVSAGSTTDYTFTFVQVVSYARPGTATITLYGGVFVSTGSNTMQVSAGITNFQVCWFGSGGISVLYNYFGMYNNYPYYGSVSKTVSVSNNGIHSISDPSENAAEQVQLFQSDVTLTDEQYLREIANKI